MNKALKYFGGKKRLLIPFLIFLGLWCIMYIKFWCESRWGVLITDALGIALLIVTMLGIWLDASHSVLFIGIILSAGLRMIFFIFDWSYYPILYIIFRLTPHLALIFLLIYSKKRTSVTKILFLIVNKILILIPIIYITTIFIEILPSYFVDFSFTDVFNILKYSIHNSCFLNNLFLFGAITFLWLPLEIFAICPKCRFRNMKGASFCGGCGNKLN